jgi:hypothetical protein
MKEKSGTISIVVVTIAALNGLFLFGNGLFMLVAPLAWYYFVPGVTHTGLIGVALTVWAWGKAQARPHATS